jgi:hypothetical protein
MAVKSIVIGLRVEPNDTLTEKLDALAAHLSRKADGAPISRADALRIAARKGLEMYEPEIAASPAPKAKRAR